jgi:predicted CoA-binding protein
VNLREGITLVLGASPQADRYSYLAVSLLKQMGYAVYALGGRTGMIDGVMIHTKWEALPTDPIDTITLYLGAERQRAYYTYLLSAHPKRIIFNPGAENDELEQLAQAAGIQTLQACTLVMLRTNQY